MQSIYSVYGTAIHLLLDDEFATNYNNAMKAFFDAQFEYMERTHQEWKGGPLTINWTPEEQKAYKDFANLMNSMIEMNGGSLNLTQDDMTSDYLVKL